MSLIIAFTGFKGSGKTEAAKYLEYVGFERVSFAAPLKESAAAALGTNVTFLEAAKNDPAARVRLIVREGGQVHGDGRVVDSVDDLVVVDISVREYLQNYGTEGHRHVFGDDFWIDHAVSKVLSHPHVVIDDCRFPNEREALAGLGGKIVRIDRPGVEGSADTHESERPLSDPDFVVANDGDIDELHRKLDSLLWHLRIIAG